MQRKRGTLPVHGVRPRGHGIGVASAKGRASSKLTATPEAFRVGVRLSPRFVAAATAPAFLASTSYDCDDEEDNCGKSQPPVTYVCNWAQAIQCTHTSLKPMTCTSPILR